MNKKKDKLRGRNFDEEPLTFREFLDCYNNFFLYFCLQEPEIARNYRRLAKIDKQVADELSTVHMRFIKEPFKNGVCTPTSYPVWVLDEGYKAYLLLREHYKDDPELRERIEKYKRRSSDPMILLREQFKDDPEAVKQIETYKSNVDEVMLPDDWPAFFS